MSDNLKTPEQVEAEIVAKTIYDEIKTLTPLEAHCLAELFEADARRLKERSEALRKSSINIDKQRDAIDQHARRFEGLAGIVRQI